MKIVFRSKKVERVCKNLKAAQRFFGDLGLAKSLLARVNALETAQVLKDIIAMPSFRFHNLRGNLKGFFAIDVKTIREKWRIILQPLDDEQEPFEPCNVDEVADICGAVMVREVSAHYE